MNSPSSRRLLYLASVLFVIILIACVYSIGSAFHIRSSTGILKVGSEDPRATISVSQPTRQAQTIGVGSAKVHLAPGDYQVAVGDKGQLATTEVRIYKQHVSSVSLNPSQGITLPSVTSIAFANVGALVSEGITSAQATKLELDLFQFKPLAKNIEIIPDSINPSHTPDSPQFSIGFYALIDNVKYRAVLNYSDLTNISLMLYSVPTDNVVFSS